MADDDWTLGQTSRRYETGRRGAGTVSSGQGDLGGKSYGLYQLSSAAGTLDEYLAQSAYASRFAGLVPASAAFDRRWRELARSEPGFADDQHAFIERSHYRPQLAALRAAGLDLEGRGPAVQDAVWSTAVQFRDLTPRIFVDGLRERYGDAAQAATLGDAQIVEAVQDYKLRHTERLFRSSPRLWDALAQRARNEKRDLLALAAGTDGAETAPPA